MKLTGCRPRSWFGVLGSLCCAAGLTVTQSARGDELAPQTAPEAPAQIKAASLQSSPENAANAAVIEATVESLLTDPQDVFHPTSMLLQDVTAAPIAPQQQDTTLQSSESAQRVASRLFGESTGGRSLLSANRQRFAGQPGTSIVHGSESRLRLSTDAGDLLLKSPSTLGVTGQRRSPIITDTRVRGGQIGSLLASGSYWFPVRQDLDTLMSKIDSRIIDDMIIIKGPYTTRLGPGHSFIDFQLKESPRYENGPESHGSTSFDYASQGERFYGRQTIWGGEENYGFRIGYGHKGGVDYESGDGIRIPGSYKSRDIDVAFGIDLDESRSLEFSYLRLDQTDTEVATQIFDFDYLKTDAFEVTYTEKKQLVRWSRFRADGWPV